MIYVDEEMIKISGDKDILVSEITILLRRMHSKGIIDKKDLEFMMAHATLSDEDIKRRLRDSISSLEDLEDFLETAIKFAKKNKEDN